MDRLHRDAHQEDQDAQAEQDKLGSLLHTVMPSAEALRGVRTCRLAMRPISRGSDSSWFVHRPAPTPPCQHKEHQHQRLWVEPVRAPDT